MEFINKKLTALLTCFCVILSLTINDTVSGITVKQEPKFIILMISDGWGVKHIEATNIYTGQIPAYQNWDMYMMSTYRADGEYDPDMAWSDFEYVKDSATDSAASATAIYTGVKTKKGMISVSEDSERLFTIADKAKTMNMAVGAVSTVQVSHATPGAWLSHNDNRHNSYAIAEEGLFGDPQATRNNWGILKELRNRYQNYFDFWPRLHRKVKDKYEGGHGGTVPTADVIIGAKGVGFVGEKYINNEIIEELKSRYVDSENFLFIQSPDDTAGGETMLLESSKDNNVTNLVALFDHKYRKADGSGHGPGDPTLAEKTLAALNILSRNENGFVIMIEAGAVDWAGHANNMDHMIGEQVEFNDAVQGVIDWVENPDNISNWENTLVVVTGDHETGYLTAGPGVMPDKPLGEVSDRTLLLEKERDGIGCRASWEDWNQNYEIDQGEKVYWTWNRCWGKAHTNSLIPLYVKGLNSELFKNYAVGQDPVRGAYIDNTDIHKVMDTIVTGQTIFDDNGVEMAIVPGGDFLMGCDSTYENCLYKYHDAVRVHLDTYAIDKTEVTVDQYKKCVEEEACSVDGLNIPNKHGIEKPDWSEHCNWDRQGHGNHPINCVDWNQADKFCKWAGKRLPTEAEWEKAARGTSGRKYPWGNEKIMDLVVTNMADESARTNGSPIQVIEGYNDGYQYTSPVNIFPEGDSPYGLNDMSGNVREWTADICEYEKPQSFSGHIRALLTGLFGNGENAMANIEKGAEYRCVRGGSWKNTSSRAVVFHRSKDLPSDRYGNIGFRCAK